MLSDVQETNPRCARGPLWLLFPSPHLPSWPQKCGAEGSCPWRWQCGSYITMGTSPRAFSANIPAAHLTKGGHHQICCTPLPVPSTASASAAPAALTRVILRGKIAVLTFWLFCRVESGQFLSHFTMRKVESRKCHLNVFLCAGKLKMFPQETLFKVCKPVTESVASAEKLTFFFPTDCQSNQGSEEHTWSTCEKPSHVIKSVQSVAIRIHLSSGYCATLSSLLSPPALSCETIVSSVGDRLLLGNPYYV